MIARLRTRQYGSSPANPRQPNRPRAGLAAGALAVAMVAAACGGSDGEPDALALSAEEGDGSTTTAATLPEPSTTVTPTTAAGEESLPTTTTGPSTATTVGSGRGPVSAGTTPRGGDPSGIYRGYLGELDPNEIVVPGAAVAPEALTGILPLTGQPGDVPDHPAAVVKIDNGSAATPHQGLNAADIVFEEEVEGGVTRFAAVFHSTPSIVGPVRSGRTTDLSLISSLGTPLLMYSGANEITEGILWSQPRIQNRSQGNAPDGYWRESSRRAPSNLFSDTAPHWASADGGPPPPQFHYRDNGEPVPGAADEEFTVAYPASTARWQWTGTEWLRWQRGSEHLLVSGEQVSAANVVVIEAERHDTGMTDSSGGAVPEFAFVGTGRAIVFTEGKRIEGTWTRPTLNSVATLTHSPGNPIELTPGRTWIQLVDADSGRVG